MAEQAYPIKPDCPAPRHNTLNAARGVKSKSSTSRRNAGCQVSGFPPCICDRAVELNEIFKAKRRERYGKRKDAPVDPARKLAETERKRRAAILNMLAAAPRPTVEPPDFTKAECRTPWGVMAMDGYVDSPQSDGRMTAARGVCKVCPLNTTCRTWVIAEERPAGSWGGMYAGMTPQNRRDLAITTHEKRQAERVLREEQSARETAA